MDEVDHFGSEVVFLADYKPSFVQEEALVTQGPRAVRIRYFLAPYIKFRVRLIRFN